MEWFTEWNTDIKFMNTSLVGLGLRQKNIVLQFPFDPSRTGGEQLLAGTGYTYKYIFSRYLSDERKSFFYTGELTAGEYFNGQLIRTKLTARYRLLPKTNFSVEYTYSQVNLPEGYNDAQLHLLGPRIDVSFTTKVFLTTYLQYNTLADNVNLNTRLQWRFKPASDLFIVYSDNYFPESFYVKNRALVFKLSYWFNL